MFSSLSDLIKIPAALLIGMAIAALAMVLFYEGVRLPLVGQVINGRVANAVETATESMVKQAELDAAKAVIERERKLRAAADLAATEAARRADAAQKLATERQAKIETLTDEANGLPSPTQGELEWLGSHR